MMDSQWISNGLPNLQRITTGVKTHWIEKLFISFKTFYGSHDPFGHLKHKLWPKEGPGDKLPI